MMNEALEVNAAESPVPQTPVAPSGNPTETNGPQSPASDRKRDVVVERPTDSELQLTVDDEDVLPEEDILPEEEGACNEAEPNQSTPPTDGMLDATAADTGAQSIRGALVPANQELRRIEEYCESTLQLANPQEAMVGYRVGIHAKITAIVGNAVARELENSKDPLETLSKLKLPVEQYLRFSHEAEKLDNLMMRLSQKPK